MSLVELKLPLDSVERITRALERIATAAESIEAWLVVPPVTPTYTPHRPHVTETNYELIAQIEQLNEQRVRRGEPPFTTVEAIAHLRREVV